MYTVKFNDIIIHDLRFDDLIINAPLLDEETNNINIFTFAIALDHKYYDDVDYGKNEITILKNDKPIYIGRIVDIDVDFYKNKVVTCESIIAYLIDSQVRPYDFSGRPIDMWNNMINQHNAQVDEYKRFKIGTIITDDPNDYITRSSIDTENTYKVINDKLVGTGIMFVNYEDRSINYYAEFNEILSQEIVLKENLINFSRKLSNDTFFTRLIPYGTDKLDIKSVNNGLDYVQNDELVNKYGIITKTIEYDDVTVASNLKTKAEEYLLENAYFSESMTITAIDLSNIDASIESFKLNYRVRVRIENHNIDKLIRIQKRSINLTNPSEDTLTLGTEEQTISASTSSTTIKVDSAINDDNTIKADYIKGVIDLKEVNLQAQLKNASEVDVRAILFEDIDPLSPTFGALSIGTQGIQIAREKNVDNLWEWGTAIDFQSVHANAIITGILSDKLGNNFWNLDDGILNTNGLVANDCTIIGTIRGSTIEGGTITGANINGGTINVDTDISVGNNIVMKAVVGNENSIKFGNLSTIKSGADGVLEIDCDSLIVETTNGTIRSSSSGFSINAKKDLSINSTSNAYLQSFSNNVYVYAGNQFISNKALTVSSDERLKENIQDINLSDLFDSATVKKYNLTTDDFKTVGVIAQDFEDCKNKDVILNTDEKGYYGVNYNALLMASIQRIKELETRLERLEKGE